MNASNDLAALFEKAQLLAQAGLDEEAKRAYVAVLERDSTHFGALTGIAGLALATGYRSAALTAYRQAVACHPNNPFGLVNLANLLLEDDDLGEARRLYERALAIDSRLAFAHQGLASVLAKQGDEEGAARHREQGFAGHSIVVRPYRGTGTPLAVLLIVSAKGGNIPTNIILDDRIFAVTALYAEFHDAAQPLPAHDIVFNAVGDADLCGSILDEVAKIVARSRAPVINRPDLIRNTGRSANAERLAGLPDMVVPHTALVPRALCDEPKKIVQFGFHFPLLLRSPGFHTGRNFVRVENPDALSAAAAGLPGEDLLVIEYFDVCGPDGMARKYRVMFIDGKLYPLHLALSQSWKVHYFTSAMAENTEFRREEELFLNDMEAALGSRAISGLEQLRDALALDYGGADFALTSDGRLLLFEANATMAIVPPMPDPIWDYRRPSITRAIEATRGILLGRAGMNPSRNPGT